MIRRYYREPECSGALPGGGLVHGHLFVSSQVERTVRAAYEDHGHGGYDCPETVADVGVLVACYAATHRGSAPEGYRGWPDDLQHAWDVATGRSRPRCEAGASP